MSLKSGGVALAVAAGLALPASAAAQSGAIPDPNSPAGKEYAMPLEQGRSSGGGGSHGGGSGSHGGGSGSHGGSAAARPLFGSGIAPSGHHAASSANPDRGSSPGSSSGNDSSKARSGSVAPPVRPRPAAHEDSSGQPALLVVFVLLGGVALAGGFRLVGRRSPPPAGA